MKMLPLAAALAAVAVSGCATSPETLSCMQPNRRVVVEVGGIKAKPPVKPGAKPGRQAVMLKALAQGDLPTAFREHCRAMHRLLKSCNQQRQKVEVFQPLWDKHVAD